MLKLPNSIEPAVMAENIVHLRDAESSLNGRVSDLEVTAPKDYSTTETATGQKWIDGKDIYMKVFNRTFGETSSAVSVSIGFDIDTAILCYSIQKTSANTILNVIGSGTYILSGNTISVTPANAFMYGRDFNVILYYTKPDPTPGDAKGPEDSDQEPEPEEKKTTRKTKK